MTSSPVYAETPAASPPPVEMMDLGLLAVPESLGKIQERFVGSPNRWVVHIQDVHGHPLAQENIAAILDHLQVVYGVSTVGIEGAWHSTSLPKFWAVPNSRDKSLLARSLLEDGYLTGPGYSAVFASMPMQLIGIEDKNKYRQNRDVYLQYLDQKEKTSANLKSAQKQIEEEKKGALSPELLDFENRVLEFRDGEKTEKFLPHIAKLTTQHQIDISNLDQVMLFVQILDLSARVQKERLQAESERLMKGEKNNRLTFEELLRSGKISADKLEYYPAAKLYLELLKLQDQVHHQRFLDQIETTIGRFHQALIKTDEEKAMIQKCEDFFVAKKMLQLQATPTIVKEFYAREKIIKALMTEYGLSGPLDLAIRFYEEAKIRDNIFFDKITKDARLEGNVAIVAGGFHTDGLREKLRAANISYIIVTPDLGGEAQNEKMYESLMKKQGPADDQTLPPEILYLYPPFDGNVPAAMSELRTTKDVERAKEKLLDGIISSYQQSAAKSDQMITKESLEQMLKEAKANQQRVLLVVSAADFNRLTETKEGRQLYQDYVANDRTVSLAITYETSFQIPADVGKAELRQGTVKELLASQGFQRRHRSEIRNKRAAVITDKPLNSEYVELQVKPSSFLVKALMELTNLTRGLKEFQALQERLFEVARQFLKSA